MGTYQNWGAVGLHFDIVFVQRKTTEWKRLFMGGRIKVIALEASGGFERQAIATLVSENLPTRLLDPGQVRKFARAAGRDSPFTSTRR